MHDHFSIHEVYDDWQIQNQMSLLLQKMSDTMESDVNEGVLTTVLLDIECGKDETIKIKNYTIKKASSTGVSVTAIVCSALHTFVWSVLVQKKNNTCIETSCLNFTICYESNNSSVLEFYT